MEREYEEIDEIEDDENIGEVEDPHAVMHLALLNFGADICQVCGENPWEMVGPRLAWEITLIASRRTPPAPA